MRLFSTALFVMLAVDQAFAGISYYSNVSGGSYNQSEISFTRNGSTANWNPLISTDTNDSNAQYSFSGDFAGQDVSPAGPGFSIHLSQETPFDTYQQVITSGTSITSNGTSFLDGATTVANSVGTQINFSDTLGGGHVTGGPNYLGWAVFNSGTLYAIGWAAYTFTPDPLGPDNFDVLKITDWAYNLASFSTSITVGDNGDTGSGATSILNPASSGSGVPEPSSIAFVGTIVVAGLFKRRRK